MNEHQHHHGISAEQIAGFGGAVVGVAIGTSLSRSLWRRFPRAMSYVRLILWSLIVIWVVSVFVSASGDSAREASRADHDACLGRVHDYYADIYVVDDGGRNAAIARCDRYR